MCWYISENSFIKNPEKYHKIAVKDIVVYKFGNVKEKVFSSSFFSLFPYKPDVINEHEELSYIKMGKGKYRERMINKGYHSYSGECKIDNINIVHDPNVFKIYSKDKKNNKYVINAYVHEKIGVFIIPKGTEYYENEKGEIVSSTIIWTGNCNINEDLREEFQEIKIKDYVLESK